MNEAVCERNEFYKEAGKKQMVQICFRRYLWKCFGCFILAVTFGNKRCRIWRKNHESDNGNIKDNTKREIRGETDLRKVSCHLYHLN